LTNRFKQRLAHRKLIADYHVRFREIEPYADLREHEENQSEADQVNIEGQLLVRTRIGEFGQGVKNSMEYSGGDAGNDGKQNREANKAPQVLSAGTKELCREMR